VANEPCGVAAVLGAIRGTDLVVDVTVCVSSSPISLSAEDGTLSIGFFYYFSPRTFVNRQASRSPKAGSPLEQESRLLLEVEINQLDLWLLTQRGGEAKLDRALHSESI
jgi:hypothetical protein